MQEPLSEPLIRVEEPQQEIITLKEASDKAGTSGYYQYRTIAFFCLKRMVYGFFLMGFPYFFKIPDFECSATGEAPWTPCKADADGCKLHIRPVAGSPQNLVTEFGLYCDDAEVPAYAESLFMFANMVGILFISPIADIVGRKFTLILCICLVIAGLSLGTLSMNIYVFLVFFSVIGMGFGPYVPTTYLYLNEFCGENLRQRGSAYMNFVRTLGQLVVGGLSALINDNWRIFFLGYVATPFAVSLPLMAKWLYESPKLLISHKKFDEAKEVVQKIAKDNKKVLPAFKFEEEIAFEKKASANAINSPSDLSASESVDQSTEQSQAKAKKETYTYIDLFKYKSLRNLTIIISVLFFLNNSLYFGTTFAVPYLSSIPTVYLTVALSISEGAGALFAAYIYPLTKRKTLTIACHIVCILACIPFLFIEVPKDCPTPGLCWQAWTQIILVSIVRITVLLTTTLFFIYCNEVYPTPVRSIGNGFTNIISRLGPAIVPLYVHFSADAGINPIFMFGLAIAPALIPCFFMKETKNLPLPDEIEEKKAPAVSFDKDDSTISWQSTEKVTE